MVHPYDNDVGGANEEMSPMFERLSDSKELPIPYGVVSFCRIQGLRIVGHVAFLSFVIALEEDGSYSKQRGIYF